MILRAVRLLVLLSVAASAADTTSVILLGTGTPYPDPERQGPAAAVVVGTRIFLFDAGTGVARQMRAAGLPLSGPSAVFFTHLHSDHTLGYPDLIFTSWVMRRTWPFPAYGPAGLRRMTEKVAEAWSEDIVVRTEGLEQEVPGAWKVDVHEIGPGVVYDSGGVRVTAIEVPHGNWEHAFAYRVDAPDRSIVISGDTRSSQAVLDLSRNVDVLVHEVYPETRVGPEKRPGGESWPEYLRAFHTSDVELGRLAAQAQPKLLVLTHIVRMGASDEEIIAGIRKGGFTGRVVIANDLDRF
jgi:ribonuclease Z